MISRCLQVSLVFMTLLCHAANAQDTPAAVDAADAMDAAAAVVVDPSAASPSPSVDPAAVAADPATQAAGGVATQAALPVAIVIGAGVAGLRAAADLIASKKVSVTVLEARDRLGGRTYTVQDASGLVEMGAQWIHGQPNVLTQLAKDKGWTLLPSSLDDGVDIDGATNKELSASEDKAFTRLYSDFEGYLADQQDVAENSESVQDAINRFKKSKRLSDRQIAGLDMEIDSNIVQEYAGSPSKLSLNWFDNDSELPGGDTVIAQGYISVVNHLKSLVEAGGGKILTGQAVNNIAQDSNGVTITTNQGKFTGKFTIITVPLGVLQSGTIKFSPALPTSKTGAIKRMGMGTLNKVILQFPEGWSPPSGFNVNWLERMPLTADQGRWREYFSLKKVAGRPIIVWFNAGDPALYPKSLTDATLVSQGLSILRAMMGAAAVPNPVKTWVTRWHDDPWSYGSYSIVAPGATGSERSLLRAAVAKKLYFAGEATHGKFPATVQGAWLSGVDAAAALLKDNRRKLSRGR